MLLGERQDRNVARSTIGENHSPMGLEMNHNDASAFAVSGPRSGRNAVQVAPRHRYEMVPDERLELSRIPPNGPKPFAFTFSPTGH